MPPVNSAPSTDVDNEATAELPVLDVAAYEATLSEAGEEGGEERAAHTDTWVLPSETFTPAAPRVDATTEMPAIKADHIPTLTAATPAYDLDHSGTHEMPAMPARSTPALSTPEMGKGKQRTPKSLRPPDKPPAHAKQVPGGAPETAAASLAIAAEPAATSQPPAVSGAIVIPPSPPLIEELRGALATADRRITELNERARIADAERAVAIARASAENAQLREQLAAHLESLNTAQERLGVQRTDQTELMDAYHARGERIAALEKELAAQAAVLDQVRARLTDSEQRAERLDVDGANLRATISHRNSQIRILEADLAARQQRETSLSTRLTEALASIDPNVPRLHADIAAGNERIAELKAELAQARHQSQEKDADLQVAEESIRGLEVELADKTRKLEEASVTVEEWRAVIAESQRSILQRDSRIQQLESDLQKRAASVADSAAMTGEEIALEGPARVLIRTDGNTDFVHVLGRRTRIGRGSDNELMLDTKHVSRYHAVLLAGPVHTSIEDLNSTNGVFVNNKRVSRQVLKDGDRVTIGKTTFRYTVRD
jgi:hypothetical protein